MCETAVQAFQTHLTSVMEILVKSTVCETTKLFEASIRELRAEMGRIQQENESLQSRMRTSETTFIALHDDAQAGGAPVLPHCWASHPREDEDEDEEVVEPNPVLFEEESPLLGLNILIKQESELEECRPELGVLKQEEAAGTGAEVSPALLCARGGASTDASLQTRATEAEPSLAGNKTETPNDAPEGRKEEQCVTNTSPLESTSTLGPGSTPGTVLRRKLGRPRKGEQILMGGNGPGSLVFRVKSRPRAHSPRAGCPCCNARKARTAETPSPAQALPPSCLIDSQCTVCEKVLSKASALRNHNKTIAHRLALLRQQIVPPTLESHPCQICHRIFSGRTSLAAHQRVHTDERPFACQLCTKTFKHGTSLSRHMVRHRKMVKQEARRSRHPREEVHPVETRGEASRVIPQALHGPGSVTTAQTLL
ncbi:hypothetical protein AAFF_G00293480 [Aldrovandia affinis]|uniref:C2H2-type domain-containing protein n=1 Tax=Aldrovandia affinis TaxID=143900 RepID=A0AAD7W1X2_9TELE|nr:hypothetical protein AAFF_G00293480 [Aldrovandia affinis]